MAYFRHCPVCGAQIEHKSQRACAFAVRKERTCRSCAASGDKNPNFGKPGTFLGRKHSEKSKQLMSTRKCGKTLSPKNKANFLRYSELYRIRGNVYLYWVEKFGEQEANRRLELTKEKHSKNNSGPKNPMYGKPAPQGSGNGWCGWYNGRFFRSLRELNYILNLEEKGVMWETAETQRFQVKYIDPLGTPRTYFPDFYLPSELKVVECKPRKLWTSPLVQAKTSAAIEFFSNAGLLFDLVDPGPISQNRFKALVESGKVRLTERYRKKFDEGHFASRRSGLR